MRTFSFVRDRREVTEPQVWGLLDTGYEALAHIGLAITVISDYQQELTRLIGPLPEDYEP